ncbi:MAG: UDP-N-acetylmuramoyl-tripeptide--D-alanyl-D-alanine ligase [Burkholderiaceae bacterium]|jgi:UDP-N-acetylmuramoyl-tripeptide--D-alanyl-D-alanine ligase|nr:UDP-N-acetylmuramoyl-tripeptide--D-alanyl-D-alanine ligase [Burkholderiaceae bacterium]
MSAMNLTLEQAARGIAGAQVLGNGGARIARVHSDTRTLQAGDLFVALRGERFDGAAFLAEAARAGAVAALVNADARAALQATGLPGIVAPDARRALGELAAFWRRRFELPLIAVTGSNGKTTVTQMIAAILRAWLGDGALATEGNFNNDIGVPLTLLRLRPQHRAAVVELGMNHPGEIAQLAAIVQPTVALVNNAQREHLEFMASVDAVAAENGSVFGALRAGGVTVFPAGDKYQNLWKRISNNGNTLLFGEQRAGAQVFALGVNWQGDGWQVAARSPLGELGFDLHIAGRHNVYNALAAIACAAAAGAPLEAIARGLSQFRPVAGRSRTLMLRRGSHCVTLVDDSYNANPDSVRAVIDLLAELPGPRLLVLGDMAEVGAQGPAFHAEAGAYAREHGIERLLAHGPLARHAARAFGAGAAHVEDMAALQEAARAQLCDVASIALKGSRFMRMERVLPALLDADAGEGVLHVA